MALGAAGDVAWRAEAAVDWPAFGLAACVLGLVLCPFAYIAIGALSGFAPAFALIALPPLLLYRYLRAPTQRAGGLGDLSISATKSNLCSGWLMGEKYPHPQDVFYLICSQHSFRALCGRLQKY